MTAAPSATRTFVVLLVLTLILCAVAAAALLIGVGDASLWAAIDGPGVDRRIIFDERGGRLLLGVCVGAALAPAGVTYQALLRNPLADPYVLGVAGGGSVTGTLALVLGVSGLGLGSAALGRWLLPLWTFAGALAAVFFVFSAGRVRGRLVPQMALLVGVILNALTAALVVLIRLVAAPQAAHQALFWLSGALHNPAEGELWVAATYSLVGVVALTLLALPLNAMALGDDVAQTSGVSVERARRLAFIVASLLVGGAVAFSGPIGFVGIIVPHTVRALFGPDHRLLIPASALLGAALVVAADILARLSLTLVGTETTVGLVLALAGAPFFLAVLRRRADGRWF